MVVILKNTFQIFDVKRCKDMRILIQNEHFPFRPTPQYKT